MLIEHEGRRPTVAESAWVAPTAVLSGDVAIAERACVLHGAVLTDEGGPVVVGRQSIVMENAVLRGRARYPLEIGEEVIVGPQAHLNGVSIDRAVFVATGVSIFPGARIGAEAEIRVGAVVHVNTVLAPGSVVPIGWVAVGDPAEILAPGEHERIWSIQEGLDFPGTVFGLPRGPGREMMAEATRRYSERYTTHRGDRVLDAGDSRAS